MRTLTLSLSLLALFAAGPASAAEKRSCRDVNVSFSWGGSTTASKVRVTDISCKRARNKVIVPCLYEDTPKGWSASRKGDRVTLRKGERRVRYTTNAEGGCVRA
jgi:hypothetical protein